MPATHTNRISKYIELKTTKKDGRVTVEPKEQDRYNIIEQQAAEALQLAKELDDFRQQFRYLQRVLAEWADARTDVHNVYITLADGALLFVAVQKETKYSAAFDDAVSEIDLAVANDPALKLIKMNTLAMPRATEETLAQFLDENMTMVYVHGGVEQTH